MASGGYRAPVNPAPVSGPGRLAKRTDGGPGQKLMVAPGQAYGDRQGLLDQEKTAAMSQSSPVAGFPLPQAPSVPTPAAATRMGPANYQGVPFGAPTQRPNEPITQGVNIGPGGGTEVLPSAAQPQIAPQGPMTQALSQMGSGLTGQMAALYASASARGA